MATITPVLATKAMRLRVTMQNNPKSILLSIHLDEGVLPRLGIEQCSSTFLLPVTCGPAARRASFVEVKASLGFGVAGSCFTFLPPALAAAARLFGGMILT
ncbi:hypothetical protein EYF80_004275 [Liparis tanakae]|uniref:Uncharacterized protein n=1 Tax=Liparis tanakae TaxID=230148 RepID=A0A4Z2J864_9TELE|nr:hypothetical protein EYF80_004275 [Liparis tanakae]